jgi:hypothetical protein
MATQAILIIRTINVMIIVATVSYWFYLYIKCKSSGFITPLTWLINVLAFYIFRMAHINGHQPQWVIDLFNLWSSVIITHGIILLLCLAWILHKHKCDVPDKHDMETTLTEELKSEIRKQIGNTRHITDD